MMPEKEPDIKPIPHIEPVKPIIPEIVPEHEKTISPVHLPEKEITHNPEILPGPDRK